MTSSLFPYLAIQFGTTHQGFSQGFKAIYMQSEWMLFRICSQGCAPLPRVYMHP